MISLIVSLINIVSTPSYGYEENYVHYAFYYDGYWGKWSYDSGSAVYGNYDGFVIFGRYNGHPSKYFFKFQINNYVKPIKKAIKYHYKNNIWWEYEGTVEYYISDVYPTMKDFVKENNRFLRNFDVDGSDYEQKLSALRASKMMKGQRFTPIGFKRITKKAKIRIEPYKKVPRVYNIFTDDCGIALDLMGLIFSEK